MSQVRLAIDGMSCGACVKHVSAVLSTLNGVEDQEVAIGSAHVSFDAAKTSPAIIAAALTDAGYPAQAIAESVT
jgi:copper chaperone